SGARGGLLVPGRGSAVRPAPGPGIVRRRRPAQRRRRRPGRTGLTSLVAGREARIRHTRRRRESRNAMTSAVYNVAVDCAAPYELARFWSALTGQPVDDDARSGDEAVVVSMPNGFNLHFERVPEPKTSKNRIHLCLRPDTRRDVEVERVLELGGTVVHDRREPGGAGWVVFADPEGNEFCVLRSAAEREAMERAAKA